MVSSRRKLAFTFDDGMLSNYTFTAQVLKKYGFSGTFFITSKSRLWDDTELEEPLATWGQLRELHQDGFEIGNHTFFHDTVTEKLSRARFLTSVMDMEAEMKNKGLPKPVSLSYPAYRCSKVSKEVMEFLGYRYARIGYKPNSPNSLNFHGELACNPSNRKVVSYYIPDNTDRHLIFVTGILNGNDRNPCYDAEMFIKDIETAPPGAIPVFAGHGMPLEVRQNAFREMVEYCANNDWNAVALKDIV